MGETNPSEDIQPTNPEPTPSEPPRTLNRGKARIEVRVDFDLDDATVFNLRNDGIKITMVTEN